MELMGNLKSTAEAQQLNQLETSLSQAQLGNQVPAPLMVPLPAPANQFQVGTPGAQTYQEIRQQVQGLQTGGTASSQIPSTSGSVLSTGLPQSPSSPNAKPAAQIDVGPLSTTLEKILNAPQYKGQPDTVRQGIRDRVYEKVVAPYFQERGYNPPPPNILDSFDQKAGDEKLGFMGRTAVAATKKFLNTGIEVGKNLFIEPTALTQKATEFTMSKLFGTEDKGVSPAIQNLLDQANLGKADLNDWFTQHFGDVDKGAAGLAGNFIGDLPWFIGGSKLLKGIPEVGPVIEQLSTGSRAVPLAVGKLPGPIRTALGSQLFQKALAGFAEGAALGPTLMGENPLKTGAEWAVANPLIEMGLGKAISTAFALGGKGFVASASAIGSLLSKIPKAERPAPTSEVEQLGHAIADAVDSEGSEKVSKTIADAVNAPDAGTAKEVAVAEHTAQVGSSPVAAKRNAEAEALSEQFGGKKPVEVVAQEAADKAVRQQASAKVVAKAGDGASQLPTTLSGAKPRYQSNELSFESDVDKALYIVAQPVKSKQDEAYMEFLRQVFPDLEDAAIRQRGAAVKDRVKQAVTNYRGEGAVQIESGLPKADNLDNTISETKATLSSQLSDVAAGNKAAVAWKMGEGPEDAIPTHLRQIAVGNTVVVYNPKSGLNNLKIMTMIKDGRINEVLGYPVNKEEVAKAVADGEKPVAVTAKDPATGSEVATVVATSSSAADTAEAVKASHPKADVEIADDPTAPLKERARIQLVDSMNKIATAKQSELFSSTPVNTNKLEEAKIKAMADFLKAGGTNEELDQLMTQIELKNEAILASTREALAEGKSDGTAKATETPKPKRGRKSKAASASESSDEATIRNLASILGEDSGAQGSAGQAAAQEPAVNTPPSGGNGSTPAAGEDVLDALARVAQTVDGAPATPEKPADIYTDDKTWQAGVTQAKKIISLQQEYEAATGNAKGKAADKLARAVNKLNQLTHDSNDPEFGNKAMEEAQKAFQAVKDSQSEVLGKAKGDLTAARKEVKSVLRFEIAHLGLDDATYRAVLTKLVGGPSSDSVSAADLPGVVQNLRNIAVAGRRWAEDASGLLVPNEAGETLLKPKQVLMAATSWEPKFMGRMEQEHPDLFPQAMRSMQDAERKTLQVQDFLEPLQNKLGEEETDKLLRKMGYDSILWGRPGAKDDFIGLQPLKKEIASKVAIKEGSKIVDAAEATGARTAREAATAKEAADKLAQQVEEFKRTQGIKKYDASGKLIDNGLTTANALAKGDLARETNADLAHPAGSVNSGAGITINRLPSEPVKYGDDVKAGGIRGAVNTLRHELFHGIQRTFADSIYNHLPEDAMLELHRELPETARKYLTGRGYKDASQILVSEAGAHIAGGDLMGLSHDEAADWMISYFREIEAYNGRGSSQLFTHLTGAAKLAREIHKASDELTVIYDEGKDDFAKKLIQDAAGWGTDSK